LKALLHIMTEGHYEGKTVQDPEFRALFTRDSLLASDWYAERLQVRQRREVLLWQRHTQALDTFHNNNEFAEENIAMDIAGRLEFSRQQLAKVQSAEYLAELHGTLGADRL
jgi:hypothetical protein